MTSAQNQRLKGLAQRIDATLKVGKAGLSDGFVRSVTDELSRHELIKVKFVEFKEEKKTLAPQLAEKTFSHLVTLIGNVAVLYRAHPEPEERKVQIPAS